MSVSDGKSAGCFLPNYPPFHAAFLDADFWGSGWVFVRRESRVLLFKLER